MIELILLFLGAHIEENNANSFCYEQPEWVINLWDWAATQKITEKEKSDAFSYLWEKGIIYKVDPNTKGCRDMGVKPNGEQNV